MDEKRQPIENEVPKHKKKSKKKGQPRADHKHEYKNVVLHSWWVNPYKNGEKHEHTHIYKVCTICGRVGECVAGMFYAIDPDKYDVTSMEHWMVDDCFDKFAKKMEEQK